MALAVSGTPAGAAPFSSRTTESAQDVTLVTGDRVHVTGAGTPAMTATVTPALRPDRSRPAFSITQRGQQLTVIPQDMGSLLPDRLDPALFDVTGLLAAGITNSTPLVLTDTAALVPGLVAPVAIDGLRGFAGRTGGAFPAALDELAGTSSGPLAGVGKIWLDRGHQAAQYRTAQSPAAGPKSDGPPMVDVHVVGIARDGRPAYGQFEFMDVRDGTVDLVRYWEKGPAAPCSDGRWGAGNCVRVPVGTYSVMGFVNTMRPGAPSDQGSRTTLNTTMVGQPEIVVDHDTTVTLDARTASEVDVRTPDHPHAKANPGGALQVSWQRTPQSGLPVSVQIVNYPGAQLEQKFFVQPAAQVRLGTLDVFTRWRLEEPDLTFAVNGSSIALDPEYYDPVWFSDVSSQYPRLDGRKVLPTVDVGTATPAELAGKRLIGALALVRRSSAISVPDQSNNAAAAGAAMVAVSNDSAGSNPDPGRTGVRLQVPTVRLSYEEGGALRQALSHRRLNITVTGNVASPYLYDLVYRESGRIPARLHYVARTNQLATIARQFRSALSYSDAAYQFQPGQTAATTQVFPVLKAPRTRIEYRVGDPQVRWRYQVSTPEHAYNNTWPDPHAEVNLRSPDYETYRPGQRTTQTWFGGPLSSGLSPQQPLARNGNVIRLDMAAYVDAAGHFGDAASSAFPAGLTTDFRFYADDRLLFRTPVKPTGFLTVPEPKTHYRIAYDVANAALWATLSTRINTEWTFDSDRPADGQIRTEPLLTASYQLPLDQLNRLPRGALIPIGLTVGHQIGATASPIASATLESSYDDGKTWQSCRLWRTADGRYFGLLSAHQGAVSLRLHTADRAGNTLTQQIIRAVGSAG
jgi:hypothetical protein